MSKSGHAVVCAKHSGSLPYFCILLLIRPATITSWVVFSMIPKREVESRQGGGHLQEEEASLSHFVRAELIPAMQESGIVIPTNPASRQPIMPGIVYVDDDSVRGLGWLDRFDRALFKAAQVFKKGPDLVLVLLDKDKNCESFH